MIALWNRKMKFDCSRQTCAEHTDTQSDSYLELLSEPKRKSECSYDWQVSITYYLGCCNFFWAFLQLEDIRVSTWFPLSAGWCWRKPSSLAEISRFNPEKLSRSDFFSPKPWPACNHYLRRNCVSIFPTPLPRFVRSPRILIIELREICSGDVGFSWSTNSSLTWYLSPIQQGFLALSKK